MATTKCRKDSEEEALFRSYPYALYFVHSPSTVSHANSGELRNNNESAFHSPLRSETSMNNPITSTGQEVTQFALSRYSSRGSNNSFLHEKKMVYDLQSHGNGTENGETRPVFEKDELGEDEEDEDEEGEEELFGKKGVWLRYFSFSYSSSFAWMFLQISWRFMVSFGVALLVFYLATKPPPPKMSIKMAGIPEFELGEGVDGSGVTTKILTCNCSMELVVDNKSKVFGLHIHSPVMAMSFGHLPFAISTGPELYAGSATSTSFQLSVGTRNKPMYGAGRSMQDLLESGKGLPLVIHASLRSRFHMVWKLINPRFHHQAQCFLVLSQAYDKKHRTQAYNSSCITTS